MSDNVVVNLAFTWLCPNCGREHFLHAVIAELSADERADVEQQTGQRHRTGDLATHPDFVKCDQCAKRFRALSVGQNPDDDPTPVEWEL